MQISQNWPILPNISTTTELVFATVSAFVDVYMHLLQWLRGLGLSELQCSEPGLLVRQGVGSSASSPTPASMSSQVSACYEIKFSGRYRGFAVSSLNSLNHHTRIVGVWCVVRAAGVDNRWSGSAVYIGRQRIGTLPEKPAG